MKIYILIATAITFLITLFALDILENYKQDTIHTLNEQKLLTSKATYNAVIDTYMIAAKKDFNMLMQNTKALKLLYKFKYADKQKQNILRGKLYRLLYKKYEQMKKMNIRQFHFHTHEGKSLLRFHSPYENGDSLMDFRKTVKIANTKFKPVFGYEGGRTYPGYRYLFPIIFNGEHLGSVEFSISFDGVEKKLKKLLPYNSYKQIMTKEATINSVFNWHKHLFTISKISKNYYIENSKLSELCMKNKKNNLIETSIKLLSSSKQIEKKLNQHKDFSLTFIKNAKAYNIHFISFKNTDNIHTGYIVVFNQSDKIIDIVNNYKKYEIFIVISAIILLILLITILKQLKKSRLIKEELIANNQSLKEAQSIAHFGSWEHNLLTNEIIWSDEVYKIFGMKPQSKKITLSVFISLIHPHDRMSVIKTYQDSLINRKKYNIQHRIIDKNGDIHYVEEHAYHKYSKKIKAIKSFGTIYDITEQVELYKKLEKFVDLQQSIVILTDAKVFQFANKSFLKFFGYKNLNDFKKNSSCICEHFMKLDGFFSLSDVKENEENWIISLLNLSERRRIVSILDAEGVAHAFFVAINKFDKNNYIINFSDISDTMLEKLQLEDQVNHDQLTSTYNRAFFDHSIQKIIAHHKRDKLLTTIIFFDIDHFKNINDTYGHNVGDKVLIALSNLVKTKIRKSDYLIRWGGEEFIIVTDVKNKEDAVSIAESIRKSIEKLHISGIKKITCSFGIAIHDEDKSIEDTIIRADAKLYESKENGRNRTTI